LPPKYKRDRIGQTVTELRLDADFYAYRACQQNEEELDWGDDLTTISSNFREVVKTFERTITSLKCQFETNQVTLYFSSSDNFRKKIDPDYKGRRIRRKPVGYRKLVQWCESKYKVIRYPQLEADDALGLHCHQDMSDFILVSPDKDMKQIACRHYNNEVDFNVTLKEADDFFYTQVLTGDQVDGYKGVPGVGEFTAQKILEEAKNPWDTIVTAYEKAGMTRDDALRTARLARILRPGEYDFDSGKPLLWMPNKLHL
jgi:5'-3' exonuclease